jgi:hypothetical protein
LPRTGAGADAAAPSRREQGLPSALEPAMPSGLRLGRTAAAARRSATARIEQRILASTARPALGRGAPFSSR